MLCVSPIQMEIFCYKILVTSGEEDVGRLQKLEKIFVNVKLIQWLKGTIYKKEEKD